MYKGVQDRRFKWTCCLVLTIILAICVVADGDSPQHDEEEIDPFDMLNFDPSQVKQQRNLKKAVPDLGNSDEPDKSSDTSSENSQNSFGKKTPPSDSESPSSSSTSSSSPEASSSSSSSSSSASASSKSEAAEDQLSKDSTKKCPKCSCPPGDIMFKNFVKRLLNQFQGKLPTSSAEDFNILVRLSASDVSTLKKFTSDDKAGVHDAHEILTGMVQQITRSKLSTVGKWSVWLEDRVGTSLENIIQFLAVVALVVIILAVLSRIKLMLSWRQILVKIILYSFILSLPMVWYELYKSAEIQQMRETTKSAPPGCVTGEEEGDSLVTTFTTVIRGWVTFEKSNCQTYYEHLLIDPLFKVPPTKVISVTIVRLFVAPMKDIGASLNEFIEGLFKGLPLTLYPIALLLVTFCLFMVLFMFMGYSIRLPFFLSIEPGPAAIGADNTETREAIEAGNRQMAEQIKAIMDTMQDNSQRLTEKIQHMERVQMAAVEYTAATQGPIKADPPTLPSLDRGKPPTRQKSITAPEKLDKDQSRGDCGEVKDNSDDDISCPDTDQSESWSMLDPVGEETKAKIMGCADDVQTVGERNSE